MANLLIMIGIPGCGKSTMAKDLLDLKYAIVSTDAIRRELHGSLKAAHDAKANSSVFEIAYDRTRRNLSHGIDTVFDATSLTQKSRDELRALAAECDAKAIGIFFTNTSEALHRNKERDEDEQVPQEVMDHMLVKHVETTRDIVREKFDRLIWVGSIQ